jgi:hypothetical protein
MPLAKIILSITAAVWLGYGAWLFFDPKGLTYLGYGLDNWSAIVEVQAMYGAVEFMLGVFTLLGVLYPKRYMHAALLLWAFIYSALVFGRTVGIIQWGGSFALHFGADALPWNYNPGAMFFLELPSATLCWISLYLTRNHPELR